MSLTFNESEHTYAFGSDPLPSVGSIMKQFGLGADYGGISDEVLEVARDRGKLLHYVTELIDLGMDVSPPSQIACYVAGYEKFLAETGFRIVASEEPIYHPERRYAGTPDRIGDLNGKLALIDLKTTSAIHKKPCAIQLAGAYTPAWNHHHPDRWIERCVVVHLLKDGSYRLHAVDHPAAENTFLAATEEHYGRGSAASRSVIEQWKGMSW